MTFVPKVRYLTEQELDSAARELLSKYSKWSGQQLAPPIPVDAIIEKFLKLRLEVRDLRVMLGEDVLGATWFDEKLIRVHEGLEEQEGRLCFTMAHEVGHWVLHRPQYEADKVSRPLFKKDEEEAPPAIVCRSSQRRAPAEWQADQFAARVLMPDRFVRAAFRTVAGEDPVVLGADSELTRLGSIREVAALVIAKGHFSNVSKEAMGIRLRTLKLILATGEVSARLL